MISIIIPLYNKKKTILKSIESVLSQTYSDWELLIVNDGSTDGSETLVQRFLMDSRIKLLNKKNGGVSSARNEGIRYAHGDWILFLDADDLLMPDALELYVSSIQKQDASIIVAAFYMGSEGKRTLIYRRKGDGIIKNYIINWIKGDVFPRCGATLINAKILEGHFFDERISRSEDTQFTLGVLHGHHIRYISKPVMVYDQDNLSLSRNYVFDKDFVSLIKLKEYSFWERVFLSNIIKLGIDRYHQKRKIIVQNNPGYHLHHLVFRLVYYSYKIRRVIIDSI